MTDFAKQMITLFTGGGRSNQTDTEARARQDREQARLDQQNQLARQQQDQQIASDRADQQAGTARRTPRGRRLLMAATGGASQLSDKLG